MAHVTMVAGMAAFAALGLLSCIAAGKILESRRARDLAFAREMSGSRGTQRVEWERAVRALARRGELDAQMWQIAYDGGVTVPKPMFEPNVKWSFDNKAQTAAIAAASVFIGPAAAASSWGWAYAAWAAAGLCGAVVIMICDLQAMIIPWEACVLLAGAGALVLPAGADVLQAAAVLGIAAAVFAAGKLVRAFGPEGALGNGDVRAAAACALFLGAGQAAFSQLLLLVLLAMSALTVIWTLSDVRTGRRGWKDPMRLGAVFGGWVFGSVLALSILAA